MTCARSQARRPSPSSVLDMRGQPRWMSLNECALRWMLRTIRGVQRSARISEALAIGQYSPYPRAMQSSIVAYAAGTSTDFVLPCPPHQAEAACMRLLIRLAGFKGDLIRPGDATYGDARRL